MLTEVVKIIYPKCSEAFFLDADTWHLEMMTPLQRHCQRTGLGGSSAVLQCSPEVIVGTQLNTPEMCSDSKEPAAPKLCDQGYSSKVKGRDCPPLCGTRQTASKYRVQFWDLALERHGQTGGSSREGPQSGRAGHLPHEETLGKLVWVSWEKGCLWGT